MNTYTDEHLNFWADRYIERGVKEYGITLLTFLAHPREIERVLSGHADPLPLLQRQRLVSTRLLEAELTGRSVHLLPRRNGAPFEALHHHAHPRNGRADFNFTRRARHAR